MAMNELRLCRVFRFLAKFFHPGNAASLFGLLYTVPDEDMKAVFLIQREEPENCLKPALPYLVQRLGGSTEEMNQGQITEVTPSLSERSIKPMVRIANQRNAVFHRITLSGGLCLS